MEHVGRPSYSLPEAKKPCSHMPTKEQLNAAISIDASTEEFIVKEYLEPHLSKIGFCRGQHLVHF